jgi:hypothetical protein
MIARELLMNPSRVRLASLVLASLAESTIATQ